jgi:hypothetical protein
MKILHITHHHGCKMSIDFVAKSLGYNIESQIVIWNYNIGHNRANELWNTHKDYYNQFDLIIVSDNSPISRIFLQNNYTGKLIIWICNRFDYGDTSTNDCGFPDSEYYNLIRNATSNNKIKIIPNTLFEYEYARKYRNIQISQNVIKTASFIEEHNPNLSPSISNKENTFYISPYHNHHIFMDLKDKCNKLGITSYYGRYNQLSDLKGIKGLINIPYAWITASHFENWSMGNVYLIPSKNFLLQLSKQPNFWWQDSYALDNLIECSEWYLPEHKNLFMYFDNWEHLKHLSQNDTLIKETKDKIIQFMITHNSKTLQQWNEAINRW